MRKLEKLEPKIIWTFFEEILEIPRPSKKEEKIVNYLIDFAKKHQLDYKSDNAGNILIKKPASTGHENKQIVILQSHMDMVCEKNSDKVHDFDNDPIVAKISGEWVKADGTTLGADDGIGIAAQLAVLSSKDIEHGPIECLFTVDEETGLTGAKSIGKGFFDGKILLNLDSEDEGELFIGCAGGVDTLATFKYKKKAVPAGHLAYEISVSGLTGGHSGDEIHKGFGNSNKILNRFLWNAARKFNIRLAYFDGGNLRNAIPREARAIITLNPKHSIDLKTYFNSFKEEVKNELIHTEPNLNIVLNKADIPEDVVNKKFQKNLFNSLYACPHGVIEWSQTLKGLVETSTNLASVKFQNDNTVLVTTSQRSSVNSAIIDISDRVRTVFEMAGARVINSDGYPGWNPNPDSEISKITVDSYVSLFKEEPVTRAIHAGLECGLFLQKYPYLDMISFGPTIKGAHSPDERLDIASTKKFWDLLLEVLKRIP
jgi:dipeptidase D